MVRCTLPVFAEVFTFRRDQCLTAATQELWLQYLRIFCWFPALPCDLSCKSLEQPAAFCVCLVQIRSYWLAAMSMCACGRAFALVTQGGVILPCHPPCSSVLSLLKQSFCLHVERRDPKKGAGLGPTPHCFPFLKVQIVVLEGPTLLRSVADLLILQGLNHLLSPAKEGETGKGLTSLYLTAESWWRRGKLPSPLPTQQPKQVRYSPEAKTTLSLWVSGMQGTGWDGFCSSAAAKETPWTGSVFVCILQINYAWTSEHDYSF